MPGVKSARKTACAESADGAAIDKFGKAARGAAWRASSCLHRYFIALMMLLEKAEHKAVANDADNRSRRLATACKARHRYLARNMFTPTPPAADNHLIRGVVETDFIKTNSRPRVEHAASRLILMRRKRVSDSRPAYWLGAGAIFAR